MKRISFFLLCVVLALTQKAQIINSLDIQAQKLQYDKKRQLLYTTVNGDDMIYGNSLLAINPFTGEILKQLVAGTDPYEMAMTYDGDYLFVGFTGTSVVKRVNLKTFSIDRTISLGAGNFGPFYTADLATLPVSNELIVVSRMYTGMSPSHAGVAAYFRGDLLPAVTPFHTGSNTIENISDSNLVVGSNYETTEYGFRTMKVDTLSGVTILNVQTGMPMGRNIKCSKGIIYTSHGHVVNPLPSPPDVVNSCSVGSSMVYAQNVEPDASAGRIYFANAYDTDLRVVYFDMATTTLIGDINLESILPNGFQNVRDLEHFEGFGLASIASVQYYGSGEAKLILTYFSPTVGMNLLRPDHTPLVYPNPARDKFTISGTLDCKIEITDQLGRLYYKQAPSELEHVSIDAAQLNMPPGIYMVRIEQAEQSTICRKLVLDGK